MSFSFCCCCDSCCRVNWVTARNYKGVIRVTKAAHPNVVAEAVEEVFPGMGPFHIWKSTTASPVLAFTYWPENGITPTAFQLVPFSSFFNILDRMMGRGTPKIVYLWSAKVDDDFKEYKVLSDQRQFSGNQGRRVARSQSSVASIANEFDDEFDDELTPVPFGRRVPYIQISEPQEDEFDQIGCTDESDSWLESWLKIRGSVFVDFGEKPIKKQSLDFVAEFLDIPDWALRQKLVVKTMVASDGGGPSRDLFTHMGEQIINLNLNGDFRLFENTGDGMVPSDGYCPSELENEAHKWYSRLGRLISAALISKMPLPHELQPAVLEILVLGKVSEESASRLMGFEYDALEILGDNSKSDSDWKRASDIIGLRLCELNLQVGLSLLNIYLNYYYQMSVLDREIDGVSKTPTARLLVLSRIFLQHGSRCARMKSIWNGFLEPVREVSILNVKYS